MKTFTKSKIRIHLCSSACSIVALLSSLSTFSQPALFVPTWITDFQNVFQQPSEKETVTHSAQLCAATSIAIIKEKFSSWGEVSSTLVTLKITCFEAMCSFGTFFFFFTLLLKKLASLLFVSHTVFLYALETSMQMVSQEEIMCSLTRRSWHQNLYQH